MSKCAVLVVAAGRGSRFGDPQPKQYAQLAGSSILRRALKTFVDHPHIDYIQPVIHPDDHSLFAVVADGLTVESPVHGGATRQESVLRGLESMQAYGPDIVLIHDGARPHVSPNLIDGVIDALTDRDSDNVTGVIPVLPIPETLKRITPDGSVLETVSRDNIVRAQTPQGFLFPQLLQAHQACTGQALTDDAAVMETQGHIVKTVLGDRNNIKITEAKDLYHMADILLENRTGTGFDVHRLGPGTGVTLGGLFISLDQSLIGHSDADVVLHAATDAILGAISDYDIGYHFPPSDDSHKGAPSSVFLDFAIGQLTDRGGSLTHLDLTIICERPKISVLRDQMRQSIATIAGVPLTRVSVKATTTEGLGFTGRAEGIACQAVASVRVPPRID